MMQFTVDSERVTANALSFTEMGFGQLAPGGHVPYALRVDGEEFLRGLGPVYAECVAELQRDDVIMGEFQPPYEGATSYPSLTVLLAEVPLANRMQMIRAFLAHDMLRAYVPEDSNHPELAWLIRTVDAVGMQDSHVVIEGRAQRA